MQAGENIFYLQSASGESHTFLHPSAGGGELLTRGEKNPPLSLEKEEKKACGARSPADAGRSLFSVFDFPCVCCAIGRWRYLRDDLTIAGPRERKGKRVWSLPGRGIATLFTCGEADRSRHGKCCSSSCCCWGDHFHFTSLMYTQKGFEKKNLCQKIGVKKENFFSIK